MPFFNSVSSEASLQNLFLSGKTDRNWLSNWPKVLAWRTCVADQMCFNSHYCIFEEMVQKHNNRSSNFTTPPPSKSIKENMGSHSFHRSIIFYLMKETLLKHCPQLEQKIYGLHKTQKCSRVICDSSSHRIDCGALVSYLHFCFFQQNSELLKVGIFSNLFIASDQSSAYGAC